MEEGGKKLAMVAFLVAVAVAGGLFGLRDDTVAFTGNSGTTVTVSLFEESVSIHVSGWVMAPGVVEVPSGSIVADVIKAAGGARQGAVLAALNLARPVAQGDRIDVPGPEDTPVLPFEEAEDGLVSINMATSTELQSLPGVGPVLADRIVAFREANGPFTTPEDLLDVPGIGESKLAAIRDLIIVR